MKTGKKETRTKAQRRGIFDRINGINGFVGMGKTPPHVGAYQGRLSGHCGGERG